MKIMMHNTKVRLPKAPIVLPIIEMSKLSVGHDFANLNTRSCKYKLWNKASHKLAHRRFTYATAAPSEDLQSLQPLLGVYATTHGQQLRDYWVILDLIKLELANVCSSYLSKMCVDLFLYEWDICMLFYILTNLVMWELFDSHILFVNVTCVFLFFVSPQSQFYCLMPLTWIPSVVLMHRNTLGKRSCMLVLNILLDAKLNL